MLRTLPLIIISKLRPSPCTANINICNNVCPCGAVDSNSTTVSHVLRTVHTIIPCREQQAHSPNAGLFEFHPNAVSKRTINLPTFEGRKVGQARRVNTHGGILLCSRCRCMKLIAPRGGTVFLLNAIATQEMVPTLTMLD